MIAPWPEAGMPDTTSERSFSALMDITRAIRNVRTEAGVEPARWIAADIYAGSLTQDFESARREIGFLARIADDQLHFHEGKAPNDADARTAIAGDVVASMPLAGMVDQAAERERLLKELEEIELEKGRAEKQLSNESFISRAPEKVVSVQRERLARATEQVAIIKQRLESLGNA